MKKREQVRILKNNIRGGEDWYKKDIEKDFLKSIMETTAENEKRKLIKKAIGTEAIGKEEAKIIEKITGVKVGYQGKLKLMGMRYDK